VTYRALNELPYSVKTVVTPGGHKYDGLQLDARICGVEIVRAGGAMRTSFSNVFVDAPIGKVLIQTSEIGEPLVYAIRFHETNLKLHFLKLPKEIERSHVIVMVFSLNTFWFLTIRTFKLLRHLHRLRLWPYEFFWITASRRIISLSSRFSRVQGDYRR